jgi:hypothetical protein
MLRVNLIPGQKNKKSLSSIDRTLLLVTGVVLIFFLGAYSYTLYESKISNTNLKASITEEAGYVAEKVAYYENRALAQKTYDLEKYLDTALAAQVNENFILSNIAKYMLPETYLDKITFNVSTGALVMNFRSVSFESLSLVFSHLLTDAKIVNAKIGGYTLALKAAGATTASTSATSKDATMQVTATWVMDKQSASVTTPAPTTPTEGPENSATPTTPGGTP